MSGRPDHGLEALRKKVRGTVISPSDGGYDAARSIWNAMIDRRPALIVQCSGAADVRASLAHAKEHGLPLAIRSGGHNIAGSALCDDGLVIDLSRLRAVQIDPKARRARVGPGATLGDFDHEAQAFGLATPLGINSTTGVAGLTLGGGFGWLSRKLGMSIDSLVAADMVTADGNFVRASDKENTDLFWAIRGGGGNFGVVTGFEFGLHPVGPEVLCGLVVFPYADARDVLSRYREFCAKAPEELTTWAVLRKAPPLPFLPATVHGKEVVVIAVCWVGEATAGRAAIEPVRKFGKPVGEHVGVQPFAAWQQAFDPLLTPGARNYWKSHNFAELSDGALGAVIEYAGKLPSPHCEIFLAQLGGQVNRVAPDATAYSHRNAKFVLNVHGRWESAKEDAACIAWARSFFDATAPHATGGVYVNFMTADESARVAAAYGGNFKRLADVKKKYDPGNLFRSNQNIAPAR